MKPFNLEEALNGKPVMLRNGRKAYVRHHETRLKVANDWQLQGINEDGDLIAWALDGSNSNEKMWCDEDEIIGMYPETRMINGFEVPAPETEELEYGTRYYIASLEARHFHNCATWDDHDMDKLWLERGLVFLNAEDAIANAKAVMGIDPNTGD